MSHSYRKSSVHGWAGGRRGNSEKKDKQAYNRRLRFSTRKTLRNCIEFDAVVLPELLDVSDVWAMAKDGKKFSTSIAGYRATLEKVSFTRDGKSRYFLTVTPRSFEHLIEERIRRLPNFWGHGTPSGLVDDLDDSELRHSLDLIRK